MSKRIITTIIVVIAVLVMVFLGIWQLDRHSEKSNINERISLRLDNEPLALVDLDILRNNDVNQIEEYEYRSVSLSGQYKHCLLYTSPSPRD